MAKCGDRFATQPTIWCPRFKWFWEERNQSTIGKVMDVNGYNGSQPGNLMIEAMRNGFKFYFVSVMGIKLGMM